jgi:hypothetical protein
MDFGKALVALKEGSDIARRGWNGKGMYLSLNKGSHDFTKALDTKPYIDGVFQDLFEPAGSGTITRMPNINMRTASGSIVTGWIPSQPDMLAEDWEIISNAPAS